MDDRFCEDSYIPGGAPTKKPPADTTIGFHSARSVFPDTQFFDVVFNDDSDCCTHNILDNDMFNNEYTHIFWDVFRLHI